MWTDERIDRLKQLWTEGHSASQIAAMLGEVTRNAVIGKVHRLGLSGRGAPHRERRSRPSAPRRAPSVIRRQAGPSELIPVNAVTQTLVVEAAPQPVAPPRPMGKPATIFTLTDSTCHWPVGDPGSEEFYFCGQPTVPGLPYCEDCARLAYQPAQKRSDRKRVAS